MSRCTRLLLLIALRAAGFWQFPWSWLLVPFSFAVGFGVGQGTAQRALTKAAAKIAEVMEQLNALTSKIEQDKAAQASREWIQHPGRPVRVRHLSAGTLMLDVKPRFLSSRRRGAVGVMVGESVGGSWLVAYKSGELCAHLVSELESALILVPNGMTVHDFAKELKSSHDALRTDRGPEV